MLAIGRCLMSNPRFIMFDEPSLGLAPVMVEFIFAAILELKNAGVTICSSSRTFRDCSRCGICHRAGERRGRIVRRSRRSCPR